MHHNVTMEVSFVRIPFYQWFKCYSHYCQTQNVAMIFFPTGFVKTGRTNYNKICKVEDAYLNIPIKHSPKQYHSSQTTRNEKKKGNAFWKYTIYCFIFFKLSNQLCFDVLWPDKCRSTLNQCLLQSDNTLWHICHLSRGTTYWPVSL